MFQQKRSSRNRLDLFVRHVFRAKRETLSKLVALAGQNSARDNDLLDLVGALEDAVSLDVAEQLLHAVFLHVALAAHHAGLGQGC